MIFAISAFLKKFGKKQNLDFDRYPEEVANIGKDIVVPYKHVIQSFVGFVSRTKTMHQLLLFQEQIS